MDASSSPARPKRLVGSTATAPFPPSVRRPSIAGLRSTRCSRRIAGPQQQQRRTRTPTAPLAPSLARMRGRAGAGRWAAIGLMVISDR
ncbi:Hypothetical protein A7982_11791 [Minicystis rosea]|nr:Hypothetical protein A7982_11791 [Minicystis rosea]